MNAQEKFFHEAIAVVLQRKHFHQPLTMKEKVLYCFADLDNNPHLQPYMRDLVTKAAQRIYNRRNQSNLLSFGHNEEIMINRLYYWIK